MKMQTLEQKIDHITKLHHIQEKLVAKGHRLDKDKIPKENRGAVISWDEYKTLAREFGGSWDGQAFGFTVWSNDGPKGNPNPANQTLERQYNPELVHNALVAQRVQRWGG